VSALRWMAVSRRREQIASQGEGGVLNEDQYALAVAGCDSSGFGDMAAGVVAGGESPLVPINAAITVPAGSFQWGADAWDLVEHVNGDCKDAGLAEARRVLLCDEPSPLRLHRSEEQLGARLRCTNLRSGLTLPMLGSA
jgi:hypothetical protein